MNFSSSASNKKKKKSDSDKSTSTSSESSAKSKGDEFEKWYKDQKLSEDLTPPSSKDKLHPCKTDFYKQYYERNRYSFKQYENFYLINFELNDDVKAKSETKEMLKLGKDKFKDMIGAFTKELTATDTTRDELEKKKLELLKFKEVRKLVNRTSNSTAQYNYELVDCKVTKTVNVLTEKSKDGYYSEEFNKKVKEKTVPEYKDVSKKVLDVMESQGRRSLFTQIKQNPSLTPHKTAFLAAFKRWIKYKEVIHGIL
jgi:hypothetical protein